MRRATLQAVCLSVALLGVAGALRAADPDGRIRVACLGDSITAGARVKRDTESYPAVLGKLLGANFDVRNFGLGSATTVALLEISWPGGETQVVPVAGVDRVMSITEGEDRRIVAFDVSHPERHRSLAGQRDQHLRVRHVGTYRFFHETRHPGLHNLPGDIKVRLGGGDYGDDVG